MEVPQDLLGLLYGMAALIPLSYPLRFLPLQLRFWYSLIAGLLVQIWVFKSYMYPIYVQHLIAFALIRLKGPKCGGLVTLESMLFLSGYHLYEIFTNYGGWSMNASALLMILVAKYSLLAYNIEDGSRTDTDKLTPEQLKYRVTNKDISFLDFMGYCNFLPTSLVGPPLQYNDYQQFMQSAQAYAHIPSQELLRRVGVTFGQTLFFGVVYVATQIYFPLTWMRNEQFVKNGFWHIFWYVFVSCCLARSRYYFGWKLSMCAVHSSGVSYSGKDFERINTVNPYVVETSIHVRQKINYWNISVQEWLRKCIYQRNSFKNKTVSQIYVFVVSAFWHGFYASYYVTFALWFTQLHMQTLVFKYCKNGRSSLVKIYNQMGILGYVLLSFLVQILFSQNAVFFLVLHGPSNWKIVNKLYFIPQIALFALVAIFSFVRPPRDDKKATLPNKQNAEVTQTAKSD